MRASANPLFPGVEIMLDKPRTVKFDFNATVELEREAGLNLLFESPIADKRLNRKMLRAMLWAGLLHEDPEMTVEGAGKLINSGNALDVMRAVIQAWTEYLPEPDDGQGRKASPPDPPVPAQS